MSEKFEAGDFQSVAPLAGVEVFNYVGAVLKIDEVQTISVANRTDVAEQILMLLCGAIDITLLVNEPGNHGIGADLGAQLFSAQTGGVDEIGPPMIVRLRLVLLPLMK